MLSSCSVRRAIALFALVGAVLRAQDRALPLPGVVALATAQHIPLEGFDAPREQLTLRTGDSITALFTLVDGGHRQQWLADVKVVPLTDEERRAKPHEDTIYSATGKEYRLTGAPAAFALRMFGPIRDGDMVAVAPDAVREKRARFLMKEDFLGFGYDRMGELVFRLRAIGQEIRLGIATGRFSKEEVAKGKLWAAQAGFTSEDELVCVKQAFAQVEFLKLAQHTPGFKEIVEATLDLPSIWSGLRTMNFGVWFNYDWKNVRQLDGKSYGLPSSSVYTLPFGLTMFGKHVANGNWLATAARPPLLTSAGIVALTIGPPDKKEKRLELRVLAAHHGRN